MKAKFIPNYPLAQLKPADYNPRHQDEEMFVLLQAYCLKKTVSETCAKRDWPRHSGMMTAKCLLRQCGMVGEEGF